MICDPDACIQLCGLSTFIIVYENVEIDIAFKDVDNLPDVHPKGTREAPLAGSLGLR